MEKINDSIIIKSAETDEELCGRGYVHCTAWKESYRGIVCDRYLDTIKKTILAGAGFTLLIEVTQLFFLGSHTDVDDLILNTIGVVIGACIVFLIRRKQKKNSSLLSQLAESNVER